MISWSDSLHMSLSLSLPLSLPLTLFRSSPIFLCGQDLSKIEAGRVELDQAVFSVRGCVEGALDVLAEKAARKKVELMYTTGERVPDQVVGDPLRLRQIIINLLSNAVKFTNKGEVLLTLDAQELDTDHKADSPHSSSPSLPIIHRVNSTTRPHLPSERIYEYHMAVKDSGIGIPPHALSHLFKSFSQVSSKEQQRLFGGTGLGLSISRQLCELMGGKMWVESVEGVGSTFHFTFRVPATTEGAGAYLQGVSSEMKGKRMLLVKSNDKAAAMIQSMVGQWGIVTVTARGLTEVEALIKQGTRWDLSLIDYDLGEQEGEAEGVPAMKRMGSLDEGDDQSMEPSLPITSPVAPHGALTSPPPPSSSSPITITGVDVAYLIRRSFPAGSSPPVLMLCALSQRQREMRKIVDAFLAKPIKPNKLFAAILSVLRPKPSIGLPSSLPSNAAIPSHLLSVAAPTSPLTPNLTSLVNSFQDANMNPAPLPPKAPPKPLPSPDRPPPSPPHSPSNISPPGGNKSAKRKRGDSTPQTPLVTSSPPSLSSGPGKSRLSASSPPSDHASPLLFARCPLRILIAEDNLINQKVLCKMLNRLGWDDELVDVAGNGEKAYEATVKAAVSSTSTSPLLVHHQMDGGEPAMDESAIRSLLLTQSYHLVFMDIQMPVMDGLEATAAIRGDSRIAPDHQPFVVALTANAMTGEKAKCIDVGMELFLSKPVTLARLVQAVKTAHAATVNKQRQWRHRTEVEEGKNNPSRSTGAAEHLMDGHPSSLSSVLSPSYRPAKLLQRRSGGAFVPSSLSSAPAYVSPPPSSSTRAGFSSSSAGLLGTSDSIPPSLAFHRISSAPVSDSGGSVGYGWLDGQSSVKAATSRMLASQQRLTQAALQPFSRLGINSAMTPSTVSPSSAADNQAGKGEGKEEA